MKHILLDIGHANGTGARGNKREEHAESVQLEAVLRDAFERAGYSITTLDFPDRSNADDLAATIRAANKLHADFGVSLHMDAADTPQPHGAHVCYYSKSGQRMASCIARHLCPLLPGRADSTVRRPGLAILNSTHAPWVLVEVGFITSPSDVEITTRRAEIARAIVAGVNEYFAEK